MKQQDRPKQSAISITTATTTTNQNNNNKNNNDNNNNNINNNNNKSSIDDYDYERNPSNVTLFNLTYVCAITKFVVVRSSNHFFLFIVLIKTN